MKQWVELIIFGSYFGEMGGLFVSHLHYVITLLGRPAPKFPFLKPTQHITANKINVELVIQIVVKIYFEKKHFVK